MFNVDYAENDTFLLWQKQTLRGIFDITSLDGQWILITKKQAFITFICIKVCGKFKKTEVRKITRNNLKWLVLYVAYDKIPATSAVSTYYAVAHTNAKYFHGECVSAL
jgi:hypothetical protein